MTPQEEKVLEGRKMLEAVLVKVEDDLIIAQFMGAVIKEWYAPNIDTKQCGNYAEYPTGKENGVYHDNQAYHGIEYLKYKKDWNWLMKAIEKIESLGVEVKIGEIDDECYVTNVFCHNSNIKPYLIETFKSNCVVTTRDVSKIISVYHAIVLFIKFYNANIDKFNG